MFTYPKAIFLKVEHWGISKATIACPHSRRIHGHVILKLCNRESSRKRIRLLNRFSMISVIMWAQVESYEQKCVGRKSRDTVPLKGQSDSPTRFKTSSFFSLHNSNLPVPLTNGLKYFRFWSRIRRVIRFFQYIVHTPASQFF